MGRPEDLRGSLLEPMGAIGQSGARGTKDRIFVSYRRADRDLVAALQLELSNHLGPNAISRDIRSIRPGEDFAQQIDLALEACDGKKETDACSVTFDSQTRSGTCQKSRHERLVCRPAK